jgi:hypothetical protein
VCSGGHDVFSVLRGPAADRELDMPSLRASLRRRFTVVACDLTQLRKQVRNESGSRLSHVTLLASRIGLVQQLYSYGWCSERNSGQRRRETIMTRPGHRLPQALIGSLDINMKTHRNTG